jgi:glycosyltransferase involved in cell wall biosynthesis
MYLLRHSSRVLTECKQVESELQKLRAARGLRFSTRRTGLRGRTFPEPDRRRAPRYAPENFVLYVSSFNRRKNHDFLVHVWRDLFETWIKPAGRPHRLVLVGEVQEEHKYGDPSFRAELRQSNIDVYTLLSDGALAHLMQRCAFTVYPSVQEGWGLPVQESLECGKICIVSASLPVAQEVNNAGLIKISPTDFYGWHEALKTWLSNPSMRRAFAARAREYRPPAWHDIARAILDSDREAT